jgi:hypothetical protein
MFQTEFEFTLPYGYVDELGNLYRSGLMRRATALDEIEPLGDPRARANEAYLSILLLSRVIVQLGPLRQVGPAQIERLFAPDFIYLQELYDRVNSFEGNLIETECPTCKTRFMLDVMASDG